MSYTIIIQIKNIQQIGIYIKKKIEKKKSFYQPILHKRFINKFWIFLSS